MNSFESDPKKNKPEAKTGKLSAIIEAWKSLHRSTGSTSSSQEGSGKPGNVGELLRVAFRKPQKEVAEVSQEPAATVEPKVESLGQKPSLEMPKNKKMDEILVRIAQTKTEDLENPKVLNSLLSEIQKERRRSGLTPEEIKELDMGERLLAQASIDAIDKKAKSIGLEKGIFDLEKPEVQENQDPHVQSLVRERKKLEELWEENNDYRSSSPNKASLEAEKSHQVKEAQKKVSDIKDIFEGLEVRLPKEKQDKLDRALERFYAPDYTFGIDEKKIQNTFSELLNDPELTPDQQKTIIEYIRRLEEHSYQQTIIDRSRRQDFQIDPRVSREVEPGTVPTNIYITEKEAKSLLTNPIGTIDNLFARIESNIVTDRDSPATQHDMARLRLRLDYLLSSEYDDARAKYQLVFEGGRLMSDEEFFTAVREKIGMVHKQKEKFLDQYTKRLHSAFFIEQYSNAAALNDKGFEQLINSTMNEKDWWGIGSLYGGLVEEASNVLHSEYESMLFDENGNLRHLYPQDWKKAREKAVDFMKRQKALYEPAYDNYISGAYNIDANEEKMLGVLPGAENGYLAPKYEDTVETIVNLAAMKMIMWMQKDGIDIRTIGPLAGEYDPSPEGGWSSFFRKNKLLSTKRYYTWHFMEWGNPVGYGPPEKAIARHDAMIHVNLFKKDVDEWAESTTSKYWNQMEMLRTMRTKGTLYTDLSEDEKKLVAKIKETYFFRYKDVPTDNDGWVDFIIKLKRNDLKKEVALFHGIKLAESHHLRPYFILESGWRQHTVDKIANKIFRPILGDEEMKGVFTSSQVVRKANDYYMAKAHHDSHSKDVEQEYLESLKNVAKYRPHSLVEAMLDRDEDIFNNWFSKDNNGFNSSKEMLRSLTRRVTILNSRLFGNTEVSADGKSTPRPLAPIDFSCGYEGLNPSKKAVVDSFFEQYKASEGDNLTKQEFFRIMKDLTKFMNQDGGAEKLLNIKYEPLLTTPRWYDDLPLTYLENPQLIGSSEDPISVQLGGDYRDEQSGAARRTWRDYASAERLKNELYSGLYNPDQKEFYKSIAALWPGISPYQGPDHAAWMVTQMTGAWCGAAKVLPTYGPMFEGMRRSSEMKITRGPEAPSMSQDELHHVFDQAQTLTSNVHFTKAAPLLEAAEDYVDVSRWGRYLESGQTLWLGKGIKMIIGEKKYHDLVYHMNEYMPTGTLKVKIPGGLIMVAIFLALYLSSTVKEGDKGSGGRSDRH